MVPTNALQRTFRFRYGSSEGTCFTIDVDARQYIVTARHVVEGIGEAPTIQIQQDGQWKDLPCKLVGLGAADVDIAVLAPPYAISPTHELTPSHAGLFLGQDVYFLGFPYGFQSDAYSKALNNSFPLPLVKKACVSLMNLAGPDTHYVLLDGHNNPGFSGGPVVFEPAERRGTWAVLGVVNNYREGLTDVLAVGEKTPMGLKAEYNTGIIEAYSIEYAVAMIKAKPIGRPVGTSAG